LSRAGRVVRESSYWQSQWRTSPTSIRQPTPERVLRHSPLRFTTGGAHEFLWEGRSRPLGLGTDRTDAVTVLAPQDLLVLYTDGLVERRDRPLPDGLHALATAGPALGDGSVADLVTGLLARAGDQRDDVCVLVAAWTPHGA